MESHLEIEGQRVDGDGVFTSVVLHHPRQEGLGEVKPRHPEGIGFIFFEPGLWKDNENKVDLKGVQRMTIILALKTTVTEIMTASAGEEEKRSKSIHPYAPSRLYPSPTQIKYIGICSCVLACVRACCVRACVRACVLCACVRACVRVCCVCACVRACVRACVLCACVRACVRA